MNLDEIVGGIILFVVVNYAVAIIGNLATIYIHKENSDVFDYRGAVVGWLYVGGIWILLYAFGVID